jgi:hypothetical protein
MKLISALALAGAACLPLPALALDGVYFGRASTGERVIYHGGRAQCGDLPRSDECWRNPMVGYTIGPDYVEAIVNCRSRLFSTVMMDGRVVQRNMKPSSEATRLIIAVACNAAK